METKHELIVFTVNLPKKELFVGVNKWLNDLVS